MILNKLWIIIHRLNDDFDELMLKLLIVMILNEKLNNKSD